MSPTMSPTPSNHHQESAPRKDGVLLSCLCQILTLPNVRAEIETHQTSNVVKIFYCPVSLCELWHQFLEMVVEQQF